jgi:hypothetical protein
MTDTDREHDWVTPADTMADLRDHLDRLARGDRLDVSTPTGTFRIRRNGPEWDVEHFGRGGGWCWRETWSTRRTLAHLTQWRDDDQFDAISVRYREGDA